MRHPAPTRFASPAASPPSGDCRTWVELTVVADDNLAALQAGQRASRYRDRAVAALRPSAQSVGRLVRPPARSQRWWLRILAKRGAECGTPTQTVKSISDSAPMPSCRTLPRSGRVRRRGLDRAGSRICRRVINPLHIGRCLRIAGWIWRPGGTAPVAGLLRNTETTCQLAALDPRSTRRLDGRTDAPADLLIRLHWLSYRRRPPGTADPTPSVERRGPAGTRSSADSPTGSHAAGGCRGTVQRTAIPASALPRARVEPFDRPVMIIRRSLSSNGR